MSTLTTVAIDSWYVYSPTGEGSFGHEPIMIDLGLDWTGSILSLLVPEGSAFSLFARSQGSTEIDLFIGERGNMSHGQEFSLTDFLNFDLNLYRYDPLLGVVSVVSQLDVSEKQSFSVGPSPVPISGSLLFLGSGLMLLFRLHCSRRKQGLS